MSTISRRIHARRHLALTSILALWLFGSVLAGLGLVPMPVWARPHAQGTIGPGPRQSPSPTATGPAATPTAVPTSDQPPIVEPGVTPTRVGTGYQFTEGPAADAAGNVYFSDVRSSRIHHWATDGTITIHREGTNGSNGLYFDPQGALIVCEQQGRRISRDDLHGNVTVLADSYDGKKLNSPNDLWVDAAAGIYFSDPRYGDASNVEQDGMHVYYLPPGGSSLLRVTDDLVQPNGLIGTPDGGTLYIADPGANRIWRYAIRPDGTLTGKTPFVERGADGMTLDERGNVYLANANRIWVYDRDGRPVTSITFPEQPSNVTFAGPSGTTLFVTARTSVYTMPMLVRGAYNAPVVPTATATATIVAPTEPSPTSTETVPTPMPPSPKVYLPLAVRAYPVRGAAGLNAGD